MKKFKVYFLMALAFSLFACEEEVVGPDDENEAQELTGTVDSELILPDLFEDPTVADYYVTSKWALNAGVTIMPGVNIMMTSESEISVNSTGYLNASGTELKPITFFGEQPNQGFWNEITFDNTNSTTNIMRHVILSDGGGGYGDGMINIKGISQLRLSNSILQNSNKYGIFIINDESTLPEFRNNIITECANYPIRLHTSQLHFLDATTSFANNGGNNYVEVKGSGVYDNVNWKKLSGSAIFMSPYNNIFGDVTIEAGASFIMGADAAIIVEPEGSLRMIGTSTERITITADVESSGYYEGITYEDSNNPLNEMQYVDVSYGGAGYHEANLSLTGATQIKISNSSFSFSQNYGIYVSRDSSLNDMGGNEFTGNEGADIFIQD